MMDSIIEILPEKRQRDLELQREGETEGGIGIPRQRITSRAPGWLSQ